MKDFLLRNKTLVGLLFGGISLYVGYSCPGLDAHVCETTKEVCANLGSFLIGAGVLPSDYRAKFVQGRV